MVEYELTIDPQPAPSGAETDTVSSTLTGLISIGPPPLPPGEVRGFLTNAMGTQRCDWSEPLATARPRHRLRRAEETAIAEFLATHGGPTILTSRYQPYPGPTPVFSGRRRNRLSQMMFKTACRTGRHTPRHHGNADLTPEERARVLAFPSPTKGPARGRSRPRCGPARTKRTETARHWELTGNSPAVYRRSGEKTHERPADILSEMRPAA